MRMPFCILPPLWDSFQLIWKRFMENERALITVYQSYTVAYLDTLIPFYLNFLVEFQYDHQNYIIYTLIYSIIKQSISKKPIYGQQEQFN